MLERPRDFLPYRTACPVARVPEPATGGSQRRGGGVTKVAANRPRRLGWMLPGRPPSVQKMAAAPLRCRTEVLRFPVGLEAGMTDRIRSSCRLIIIGAALLAASAVVLVLGVIPPVRSDTFRQAAPGSAAAAFLVQAALGVLAAIALAIVATRAAASPRSSIAILHVIGALMFLLGIALAGPALTFWIHGPALHGAVLCMFLSAAAEFAATGLVVAAAQRLSKPGPEPAPADDTSAWKMRVAPASLLGLGSFFLMFLLGEGLKLPANVPAAEDVGGLIVAIALGGYSLLATCVLSLGLPRARRNLWIVLAINAVLLLAALIALLVEPDKSAAVQVLGVAIFSSACSYGGLALAARRTRPSAVR